MAVLKALLGLPQFYPRQDTFRADWLPCHQSSIRCASVLPIWIALSSHQSSISGAKLPKQQLATPLTRIRVPCNPFTMRTDSLVGSSELNTDEDRTAARNAAICTAQCQVRRCGPSDERAPDFGAVVGDYEMGLEISDAEPLTTFDRASQPAEWSLSEESSSHDGATKAQVHRTRAPPISMPASLAEFARANNN